MACQDTPSTVLSDRPRSYIEKIKLPTFSGKLEAWPDFLKTWSDITGPEKMTEAV